MALIADHAGDRAEQLVLITARLTTLIEEETQRIDARLPPAEGEEADEKNRLANTYRLELARIKQDPDLIKGAPPATLAALRQSTVALHETLARHEAALNAVKIVSEGLVHAMAEEMTRQRSSTSGYAPNGGLSSPAGPQPAIIDRKA
ncbi:MAG: flagellar basal-body protein FlbY [Proteobacteria bacterium]|nr:flagellar basal-body protein FlbY [Pseudomonadota bacterium]